MLLLAVVGETGSLQVTPRTEVIDSPGLKQGITSICERLHIHGLQRLKHIDKYAHSLKLTLLSYNASNSIRTSIDVCFHRWNLVPGSIYMCVNLNPEFGYNPSLLLVDYL